MFGRKSSPSMVDIPCLRTAELAIGCSVYSALRHNSSPEWPLLRLAVRL
jgi:hypothetical protein